MGHLCQCNFRSLQALAMTCMPMSTALSVVPSQRNINNLGGLESWQPSSIRLPIPTLTFTHMALFSSPQYMNLFHNADGYIGPGAMLALLA